MSDNDEYIKFKSADELKKWLVNDKKVDEDILGDAATTLFNRSFLTSSSLMGISDDKLERSGLSIAVAMELSNKLMKKQQQELVVNVLTKVDERLEKVEARLDKADKKQDSIVMDLKEVKTHQQQHFGAYGGVTPLDTASTVGRVERLRLEQHGLFHRLDKQPFDNSEPAILDEDKLKFLKNLSTEHHVVVFMTPIFEELLAEDGTIAVVNSEQHAWIKTKLSSGFNQKPDMFFCHTAIYNHRPPFTTIDRTLIQLRNDVNPSDNFKYGVLADWTLRDCIDAVGEAKKQIDDAAFGEVINYARHICFVPPDPEGKGNKRARTDGSPEFNVKFVLYDVDKFWLIQAHMGTVLSVDECPWTLPGSRKLFQSFLQRGRSPWIKLLIAACNHWDLQIQSDAFLGKGAFGRVFKVSLNQHGRSMFKALKIVLHDHTGVAGINLQMEMERLTEAAKLLPACVAKVEGVHDFGDLGAAMLLTDVGGKVPRQAWKKVFETLGKLHEKDILHGDPRPANAIYVNKSVQWIDFLASFIAKLECAPIVAKQRDMWQLIIACCCEVGAGSGAATAVADELVRQYDGTPMSAVAVYQTMIYHEKYIATANQSNVE